MQGMTTIHTYEALANGHFRNVGLEVSETELVLLILADMVVDAYGGAWDPVNGGPYWMPKPGALIYYAELMEFLERFR